MAKTTLVSDQTGFGYDLKTVLASLYQSFDVNAMTFWRQLQRVLTPTLKGGHMRKIFGHSQNLFGHVRILGWPHGKRLLVRLRKAYAPTSEDSWPRQRITVSGLQTGVIHITRTLHDM